MAAPTKPGFDRYFDHRMKDATFAREYGQARAEIDAVDTLIRALDDARERSGLTKAGLARRIDAKPEIVRRLLTDAGGNPTMATVLKLASALGCRLELVPHAARSNRARRQIAMPGRPSRSAEAAAASQQARLRAMSARDRILLALRLSGRLQAPGRFAR